MCVWVGVYIYIYTHTHMHVCIHTYICIRMYTYTHMCVHTYIYTYTYVCIYTYSCIYKEKFDSLDLGPGKIHVGQASRLETQTRFLFFVLKQNSFLFGTFNLYSSDLQLIKQGPPTLWKMKCFTEHQLVVNVNHL